MTDLLLEPPGRRTTDRRIVQGSAAAAVLVHVLLMLAPLPDRPRAGLIVEPEDEGPAIGIWKPPPPPPPEPPQLQPRETSHRLPVPLIDHIELEPVAENPVPIDPGDWEIPQHIYLPSDVPGPPPVEIVPDIVDESATGLLRPEPCPDNAAPRYPRMAIDVRLQGRVILEALIGRDGTIESVELLHATRPDVGFSQAAIEAVRGWCYTPGRIDGHPVRVRMRIDVEFILE